MAITPEAGRSLAAWLAMVHPEIFNALVGQHLSKGLGDWTDLPAGVDPANTDVAVEVDPTISAALQNVQSGDIQTPPDNSSSPSSWISSIGSGVANAVSNVGNWLTTGGGLNALANTGTAFFKAQANQSAAQAQQAVLQTQIARAGAGQIAAPITYVRNPQTGALQATYVASPGSLPPSLIAANTPFLQSGSGVVAYPLTPAGLSQLTPATFLSQYGVWIVGGIVALLVLPKVFGSRA